MELKNSILEAIGNTPLVRLNKVTHNLKGELYAKCEFLNPGGSIKDRIGLHMIEKAEARGDIKSGATIVEATSGNTGMGLAIAAAVKGYRSIFVMPDKMSEEKRQNLRAFGSKVVITPSGVEPSSPYSHYSVGARLAKETPNAFYGNQYHNSDNAETHYKVTGPEIWRQTEGKFDAIVIGMGTCGTISGIGRFLKEKNKNIRVIGVDPKGSILKDLFDKGSHEPAHSYKVEGIGEDMKPGNCDFSVIDEIVRVEDKESLLMTRELLTQEGIFSGTSSGAAVVGAIKYMKSKENPGRVLVILPDSGNRYLSKVFNDSWMVENSFLDRKTDFTVQDVIQYRKCKPMKVAQPSTSIETAVKWMRDEGISQLPVMQGDRVAGIVTESILLKSLMSGLIKPQDSVEAVVDSQFDLLVVTDPIAKLQETFGKGKVALIREQQSDKASFILTKIDLLTFLSGT